MAIEIVDQKQTTKFSKVFMVTPGYVVVISSFNFRCAETDKYGDVTRQGDCAVLHKIDIVGGKIPHRDGCVDCEGCVLDSVESQIVSSEPVVQCGELWTHTPNNNLTVLSVPGYYMFELCDKTMIGSAIMRVEELTVAQAQLLPRPLFHGE